MKMVKIILGIMGAAYVVIGGGISLVFLMSGAGFVGVLIPGIFVVLGIGFLVGVWLIDRKQRLALKNGKRIPAKIHSYVQDHSMEVNGSNPFNTRVHYWDDNGIEREAVLKTTFARGESMFPIGATIDIYEYEGYFGYDEHSLRNEILPREDELMDNKPLDPKQIETIAAVCPNCGASFEAARHYVNRCPYCDSYLNV